MSAHVEIEGLDDLIAELRKLPRDLADEATVIVERAATTAFNQISINYSRHWRTGELATHMRQTEQRSTFGADVLVKNTSKLAYLAENGTQARHYITHNGVRHVNGRMPALHAFQPPVDRNQQRMYDEFRRLLQRHGMEVSGDATT